MDLQKKYSTPDGFALAVVHSGGTRFVGKVPEDAQVGDAITMRECCELRASVVAIPTPQGLAISPQTIPCLVDGAEGFIDVRMVVHVLRPFNEMNAEEAEKYVVARKAKVAEIQRRNAERAGITLATEVPKGGFNGGFKPPSS
jgi:hypothetical protein